MANSSSETFDRLERVWFYLYWNHLDDDFEARLIIRQKMCEALQTMKG